MKKLRKIYLIIIVLFSFAVFSSCDGLKGKINPGPFIEYSASIFKTLTADEMTLNFLLENRAEFGLESVEPRLPTPGSSTAFSKLIINLYFGQMPFYHYDELTEDEQITYLLVEDLLDHINSKTTSMDYLDSDYLGSYLGYQAQLPLLLAEYNFRTYDDIMNYFAYLDLVPDAFKSYVDFEYVKAENGYGMPDYVIDKVIAQSEAFLESSANHFLITTFPQRINELNFLTSQQREDLIQINYEKVTGPLCDGYRYIRDHLEGVRGQATNNYGLAHYEEGKEFYQIKFKKVTGYDIALDDAIIYLDDKINGILSRLNYLQNAVPSIANLASDIVLMNADPLEQLLAYKEKINGHFPRVEINPEIEVKYIDPSMEDFFSPAAYMTSPIDNFTNEFIYLNDKKMRLIELDEEGNEIRGGFDWNYLYTTIAHEAFPGHMYQNMYFKAQDVNPLRKVLKSLGYMEGWATYAQMYAYNFVEDENPLVLEYLRLFDELNGAFTARLDMGIHYEGWTPEEFLPQINRFGANYSFAKATEVYQRLVEVPTNSQAYYFTYFKIIDLRNEMQNALMDDFDIIAFHEAILDCGPIPLRYVEERVKAKLLK